MRARLCNVNALIEIRVGGVVGVDSAQIKA